MSRPTNRTVDTRRADHWPTKTAKERYRRQNRKRIARAAQKEHDEEARGT